MHGSAVRTYKMAMTVAPNFRRVHLIGHGPGPDIQGHVPGFDISHTPKPSAGLARVGAICRTLFSTRFGFDVPDLRGNSNAIIQLESPFLLRAAKDAGMGRFILNAHNVYQEFGVVPQAMMRDRIHQFTVRRREAHIEVECWREASHVIFCSERDLNAATELYPGLPQKSSVIPNCVDTQQFTPRTESGDDVPGPLAFIGTTRYPPNYHAVEEICNEIAPRFPESEFEIIGAAPIRPRRVPSNVRFMGRVASPQDELRRAQIALAPVRHGSGTRLKILEYLASGLPVVCTPKAAEGIDVKHGTHLLMGESTAEIADAIEHLLADPGARARLGRAGRELVERRYDWRIYRSALLDIYRDHLAD